MFSLTAEYALRAVLFLGNHPGSHTTAEIAAAVEAPAGYLAKVMQGLNRTGLVASQRGLHGGFTLARQPQTISVFDVITAVDAFQRITQCPLGNPAHASGLCPLHQRMDNVMAAAENVLRGTTIQELLDGPAGKNVCDFPCVQDAEKTGSD